MDCEVLRRAFFDRLKVLARVDDDSAMIKVLLTDERTPEGTVVHSQWSSREDFSVVDFPLPDLLLPGQYDSAKIQSAIITLLSQGVLLHIRVKSGTGLEEVIVGSLSNPDTPPTESSSPFYMDIGVSGSASKNGIGAKNLDGSAGSATSSSFGSGSLTMNRSTERTRWYAQGMANYSKNSQPGADGAVISADNFSRWVTVMAVYSLNRSKRWNVAIIGNQSADPGSNLDQARDLSAGLEYNLVPFRVDQPYEFRVRAELTNHRDRLVLVNDRGNTNENYRSASLQLYAYWLLLKDKANVTASLSADKNLSHSGYFSTSAYLSFSYQITRGIRIDSGGSYGYLKKNMRFPAVPDYSNPLRTQYLSGYSGGSYSTSVGLSFTIGKGGAIFSRDRRFQ
jgi:hypothetical protein